jgi:hypothetical protein
MILLGNSILLHEKLAVVINSSQSKTPCGNDSWIKQSALAVSELLSSGYTIITSIGITTWELPVYLVKLYGGNQVIISPVFDGSNGENIYNDTLVEFGLNRENAAMIFVKPEDSIGSPKENWIRRDKAALSLAQSIVPVSIRPGGRIQDLLDDDSLRTKFNSNFNTPFSKPLVSRRRYQIKSIRRFENWNFITHWTKTCHGPWPGEKKIDYYARLVASGNSYPGQAFDTLGNIISEGKISGSSNWMRGGSKAIGFTETEPSQALSLMRWRSKRVNWNFEPYGVAIDKTIASEFGIRPVIYGDDSDYKQLSDQNKPYFQSRIGADVDWSLEREWRHIGDLDLDKISSDKIVYLVWEQDELVKLKNKVSGRIMAVSDI